MDLNGEKVNLHDMIQRQRDTMQTLQEYQNTPTPKRAVTQGSVSGNILMITLLVVVVVGTAIFMIWKH